MHLVMEKNKTVAMYINEMNKDDKNLIKSLDIHGSKYTIIMPMLNDNFDNKIGCLLAL
jgi:hypothetical protein